MQSAQSHSVSNQQFGGELGISSWMGEAVSGSLGANPGGRPESPKAIIRCSSCRLVQYETRSGYCRRCDHPLQLLAAPTTAAQEPALEPPDASVAIRTEGTGKVSRRDWSAGLRQAVARRTRERRMELGVSQVKFARMLGIPRSYLSRVENEHLLPGPAMLARFAAHLSIDFCSLWQGHEPANAPADQTILRIIELAECLPPDSLARMLRQARQMAGSAPLATAENLLKVA